MVAGMMTYTNTDRPAGRWACSIERQSGKHAEAQTI